MLQRRCGVAAYLSAKNNRVVKPTTRLLRACFSTNDFKPPFEEEADVKTLLSVQKFHPPIKTGKTGISIIHDPLYNKGTGFKPNERDRLGLRGLVPPRRLPMNVQLEKLYKGFQAEANPLRKNLFLADLQSRNETLFFRLLIDHIDEMAPVVYTPTVGLVCQKFGGNFRRPRGMYFSADDRSQFGAMVHNWPCEDVEIIVVTDGSRILGLGDLGANGMGIPIGKLALYTAAGGVDPRKVLPVMLDVGTNNTTLQNDPHYLGLPQPRVTGAAYWGLVDEFMRAVRNRWPRALVQFEDFSSDHAADILHAYRLKQLCFNDDIQGTGATVLAGALSACRIAELPLTSQRIVVLGAGSAGLGVATTLLQGMVHDGLSLSEARARFYLFDQHGLLGTKRDSTTLGTLAPGQQFFTRRDLQNGMSLESLVAKVAPTMILGLSASAGAFTESAVRAMATCTARPIVFPLSNPTSVAECTAQQAYDWTDGRCIFASGSPFPPVTFANKTHTVSQCNNMFIFPGLGLAAILSGATRVTDRMLYTAAKTLSECVTPTEQAQGLVFPAVSNIRRVSLQVATAVFQTALDDKVATIRPHIRKGAALQDYVASKMYDPVYRTLVP